MLYYINDAIKNITNKLAILDANIRDMRTNLEVLLNNLNYTFPIIGVTETWLKPHNVENFYLNNYSHEFDIIHKKTGGTYFYWWIVT